MEDWRDKWQRRRSLQLAEYQRMGGEPCPRCGLALPDDCDEWMGSVYLHESESGATLHLTPTHTDCLEPLERKRIIRHEPYEARAVGLIDEYELEEIEAENDDEYGTDDDDPGA
jgi:hypothetical protein